jgi:hypothetical protein
MRFKWHLQYYGLHRPIHSLYIRHRIRTFTSSVPILQMRLPVRILCNHKFLKTASASGLTLSHQRFMATTSTPPAKKQKMEHPAASSILTWIGTHNGTFHCDEALAVFLLRQTNTYRGAHLKRSRDPNVLETCDIVVDVGAEYDAEKNRFDHHQRGFSHVFGHGFETKLSSAGLVYKYVQFNIIDIPVS